MSSSGQNQPAPAPDSIDHVDRLPDPVFLLILSLIGDVKALGRCCVISRRFHALIPFVDSVVVRVDCVVSDDPSPPAAGADKSRGVFSHLARLVLGGIVKPFQALGQILAPSTNASVVRRSASPSLAETASHHSPTEVLRKFKEIRHLRIELPAGELGVDEGVLLKWKAEFGATLNNCVILGASAVAVSKNVTCSNHNSCFQVDDGGIIPESFYANGNLRLRVVWTISSLIAASARHYLIRPIIGEHEMLESLELTDLNGQGVLRMNRWQLKELRSKPVPASGSSQRTLVPALSMRLWYAAQLELPGGIVLKGATLLAIRPSDDRGKEVVVGDGLGCVDNCWISNAFEEPYRTAAKMLVKRRTYTLEMNSF